MWLDRLSAANGYRRPWTGAVALLSGALLIAGLAAVPVLQLPTAAWWLVHSASKPSLLLPLAGFGLATGVVGRGIGIAAAFGFTIGLGLGFADGDPWDRIFAPVPHAFENQYYSAPVAAIAVGLTLISPRFLRGLLLPVAAICVGAMMALCIVLTDPEIGDRSVPVTGIAFAVWLIVSLHACARQFHLPRIDVGVRIVGSWMIAIGALYGGANLFKQPTRLDLQPPSVTPQSGIGLEEPPVDGDGQQRSFLPAGAATTY